MEQQFSDLQISRDLDVPLNLVRSLRGRNYDKGIEILNEISTNRTFLKQYKKEVRQVKESFCRIFDRKSAYFPDTRLEYVANFDETIASYVHQLGVDTLVEDMREQVKKGVRSIVFFFLTKKHHTSRWERMVQTKMAKGAFEPDWVLKDRERFRKVQAELTGGKLPLNVRKGMVTEMNGIKARLRSNGFVL
jgi:hypothetical protein